MLFTNSGLVVIIPDSKFLRLELFIHKPAPVRFAEPVFANLPSMTIRL